MLVRLGGKSQLRMRPLLASSTLLLASSTSCTGNSTALAQLECSSWIEFFDSTGGTYWSHCQDSRTDPCSCNAAPAKHVECGNWGGSTHVTKLELEWMNLTGTIPEALTTFQSASLFFFGGNKFEGTIPESLGLLSALHYFEIKPHNLALPHFCVRI